MKSFQFMFVFMLVHFEPNTATLNPGMDSFSAKLSAPMVIKARKMLEEDVVDLDRGVNIKDYDPLDPVPDLKRSVQHGVIVHDNPLMPYIPKPSPAPTCSPCP